MVVLMILLALILLIFFVPYGVDAAYEEGTAVVRIAAGPFRYTLYPKKPQTEKQKIKAQKKQQKKEAKKKAAEAKKPAEEQPEKPGAKNETIKLREKLPMDFDHLMMYLKLASHAIRRFFKSFAIDLFKLHYTVAGFDPYNTAMQYGCVCSAVEALPEFTGEIIHVRKNDVRIATDFTADKPVIAVRIVFTVQLFKLVHMAVAFLTEYLIWNRKLRRETVSAPISERKEENGRQQDQ